jgi:hypothetical protein
MRKNDKQEKIKRSHGDVDIDASWWWNKVFLFDFDLDFS